MSRKLFDDDCPGCRPVILDQKTLKQEPDDSPIVKAMDAVWAKTTYAERQAFHRCTCLNSREEKDLRVMQAIADRLKNALAKIPEA